MLAKFANEVGDLEKELDKEGFEADLQTVLIQQAQKEDTVSILTSFKENL